MLSHAIRHILVTAGLCLPWAGFLAHAAEPAPSMLNAMAQAASPQAIADYQQRLADYKEARAAFDADAGAYWKAIADKRRARNAKRRDRVQITTIMCWSSRRSMPGRGAR
jgi:hypothetical protein